MTVEVPWDSIPALVRDAAERYSDSEAVVDGEVRLSFQELAQATDQAARGLIAAGVAPGDRVAIWAPNICEWITAALGALSAGAVLVPLNTRFKGEEATYILAKSGARILFTVTEFLGTDYVEMLRAASGPAEQGRPVAGPESLRRIVVMRGPAPAGTVTLTEHLGGGAVVADDQAAERAEAVGPDDISDIIFTSGTTGKPKGVMVTHAQSLRVFATWSDIVGLREGDRYLVVNPFFHTFGYKAGVLAALMKGATIVPLAVFDVDEVLAKVAEESISMLPGPPTLYQSILNHPARDRYDLSSLRLAVTGAAAVPVELIKRMREELSFETIVTAYGLTESTGTATICHHDDDPETISRTSGRAIPDTEVRIVDDDRREVPRGQPGEIVVRGYNVMVGYLDDPEATSEAIDSGGWLHTGDIGVMDERGYVAVTDRKKDMYIVGGFNAYPAEIENILLGHPQVAQVAVVGAPDDRLGEVGVAFVVARPGEQIDAAAMISWARERMANYKVPRRVEVTDSLPLNASGKVLKYELRRRAGEGSHSPGDTPGRPTAS